MSKINIFVEKKEIDLPTLIDSRFLICANSGGGKSYAVRKLLEETHGKVMSIVLDIEGEFKTLREKYDFLLIGEEGDVPLNQKAASLLPKKLLELNVSTIIDISELKRNERINYVKKFLESLMDCKRKLWKPCLVILDEAHVLAGQQEKQDSTHSVIDLMTRGRKRGFCGVLCTQRISKLHKDAVAECNNYMIGRTGLDIDMKRASEILGFTTKLDMLSLRDLDAGEFYVFGTAISKAVIKAKIAEVKTTHPKVGMDLKSVIVPPTPKIKDMLTKLSDLPKEAVEQAKTTQDLHKNIRELSAKLRVAEHQKPKQEINPKVISTEVEKQVKEVERKYQVYIKPIESNLKVLKISLGKLVKQASNLLESKAFSMVGDIPVYDKEQIKNHIVQKVSHQQPIPIPYKPKPTQKIVTSEDSEEKLNLCEKKIYSLLAQYPEKTFSKSQIGVFTAYSKKSGSFGNAVSHLRSMGLIEGTGNNIKVSVIDAELIDNFDFSKEAIISKLNKCEREVYNVLLASPHEEYTKEEIAELTLTNYSSVSGSFGNAISRLNTLGMIERNSGKIKLNPELLGI